MKIKFIVLLLFLTSCTFLIKNLTSDKYEVVNLDKKSLKIVFSHNINGETHPCGCRHNPLGGLPQVAGAINEMKKDSDILYVDTGDTFFPSAKFPKSVKRSLNHTAGVIAKALDDLGLKYFVPGDQDFGMDMKFLKKVNDNNNFTFLISNLKDGSGLKHKTFSIYKKGPHEIFIMGVVDPEVLSQSAHSSLFLTPLAGIKKTYIDVLKAGYKKDNPFHRLILLSHSGIEADETIAKEFPHFDWIVGAHTQSFTRFPVKEGKTSPVQVLSRNHYIGEITIDLTKDRTGDSFKILEMRDAQKDKLKPNPYIAMIGAHKEKLKLIQTQEQNELLDSSLLEGETKSIPHNTAASCIECHTAQGDYWQGTAHSIAYGTLITSNEEKNLTCVKCHSYGLSSPKGFQSAENLINIENEKYIDGNLDGFLDDKKREEKMSSQQSKLKKLKESYWKEVGSIFKNVKSIRKLATKETHKISVAWQKLDEKHSVSHNFANVQCLNCHNKHEDHPFTNLAKESVEQKYNTMKAKCLSCHDPDQSPEWYKGKEGAKTTQMNELILIEKMKKVSCPKIEE